MAIADILAEKEELEQKYLEKIVELSHADQVIEMLGEWLNDFDYLPAAYDPYHAIYDRFKDRIMVEIIYGAAYGYRIRIDKDRKEIFSCDYVDYTGNAINDAAKIYGIIMKELM